MSSALSSDATNVAASQSEMPQMPPWPQQVTIGAHAELARINAWLMCEQLESLGVSQMSVEYRGSWDCSEFLKFDHDGIDDAVLKETVHIYKIDPEDDSQCSLLSMPLDEAFDVVIDSLTDEHHSDYSSEHGGGGTFVFHAQAREVLHKSYENVELEKDVMSVGSDTSPFFDTENAPAMGQPLERADEIDALNRRLLLTEMKKIGVTSMEFSYNGSGDDGHIEFSRAEGAGAEQIDREIMLLNHRGQFERQSIESKVEFICNNIISQYHCGYETGEGGGGRVTIDVVGNTVRWSGYNDLDCETEKRWNDESVIPCTPPAELARAPRP